MKSKSHKLHRLLITLTGVFVFLTAYSLYPVFAAPPTTPYAPGETTDPSCAPGDPNCSVYTPLSTTITTSTSVTLNTSTLNFGSGLFYLDGANNLLGVGTTTPAAKLHIVTTTQQLRLGYSAAAYTFFTVGSDGALTVSSTGGATTTLSNALVVAGAADWRGTILNTTGDLAIGDNVVITGNATTTGNLQVSGLSTLATTTLSSTTASALIVTGTSTLGNALITSSTITTANLTTANINTLTLTGNSTGINISHITGSTTLAYLSGNQTLSGLNTFSATSTFATTTIASSTITTANIATLNVTSGITLPSNTVSSTHLIASGVTSGSYGSASAVPVITIDEDGRITTASTSSIAINTSSISGIFAPASGGTGTSTFSSGGLIFSNGAILTQNPGSLYWDSSNSRLGLGTAVPSTTLHSLSTTEQLRLGYDASNYTSFTVGSSGALTITPSGSATTTVSNALAISGAASLASTLGVTGHTTLSTVSSTNATFSGTLLVSGASTLATTTITSSTITTANIATLNVTSGLTLPSNTVSSTHLISSGVTSGSYGSASAVPVITIDEDGRVTIASTSSVSIANTQVSGLGTISTQNANDISITGGSITGITDLAIAEGGTGTSTASGARQNLGLVIGTDVQAYHSYLNSIAGGTWTGSSSITNVGTITSGAWSGTAIANTKGGTGGDSSAWTGFLKVTSGTWGTSTVSLTSDITGVLPIANGGTNSSTIGATGTIAYSSGSYLTFTAVGDSGQVLQSQGSSAPVWVSTSSLGISSMPAGTSAQTLRHDGSNWVATSFLVNDGAKIGINTATPSTTLHIVSSTEQLRLGYDAGNYTKFTVASDGQFTIAPSNFATTTINSALLVATGTEALPSLSFKNDPNTGIWNPSADSIRMSFGGVGSINFTAGVVAANTHQTYDNVSIVIKGYDGNDSSAIGVILNNNTELTTAGGKLVSIQNAGNEKAFIDKDGGAYFGSAVGIATSTPGARLHVVSTTEQLRLGYDAGNYTKFTVASNGSLTVTSTGGATTTFGGAGLVLASQTAYPTGPTAGQMFYSSTSNTMYLYNGTSWVDMATTTGGGSANMYSSTSSVASGSYVEVAHNQSTTNLITSGWIYNSTAGQWRQVAADLNAIGTHATSDTNLKGWWKMEESSGVLADQTSNGHTFQTGASSTPTYAQVGKIDKTLSFDGVNDFFYATSTAALQPTSSISIGGWVQFPEAFSANTHYQDFSILDKGDYKLGFDRGTGKLKFELNSTSSPAWATSYDGSQERFQSFGVYNDKLYGGQAASVGDGDVYVYGGSPISASWAVSYNGSLAYIASLAAYKGKLYAGQAASTGNSDVLEFDGTTWSTSYDGAQEEIFALAIYNSKLYAGVGVGTGDGDVLVFDGSTWSTSYDGAQERISSFAAYNGKLYAGQGYDGSGDGDVLVFDGSTWSTSYDAATGTYIGALAAYNGKLYAGDGWTTGEGDVLVFDGTTWSTSYDGAREGIDALVVYNGKLYAAQGDTAGAGDIFVCNPSVAGGVTTCDNAADWSISYDGAQEDIFAFAVYNGKLYAGQGLTDASGDGDIFVFGNNQVLTSARSTWDPGRWYQVVGTYDGSTMNLYVNGKLESSVSTTITINTGTTTLYLGSDGGSNLFKGKIDEAFVYNDALTSAEIATLYGNNDEDYRIIQTDNNTLRLYNYSGASQTLGLNAIAAAAATGTGAILSDRNMKDNFLTIDPEDILNKVNQLSIMQWNYKSDNPSIKHLGPFAQDFRAAFGLGNSDTTISIIDTVGVSLLSIQALSQNMANLASSTVSSVLRLENRLNLTEASLASSTLALQNNILTLASDMTSSTASLQNQYLALNNQYLALQNDMISLRGNMVTTTAEWQNQMALLSAQMASLTAVVSSSAQAGAVALVETGLKPVSTEPSGNIMTITGDGTFGGKLAIAKRVRLGADTAGVAVVLAAASDGAANANIETGFKLVSTTADTDTSTTIVRVVFDEPYDNLPIVTIAPMDFVDGAYRVASTTKEGFYIVLERAQDHDVRFGWHAFESADDARVFYSDGNVGQVNMENVLVIDADTNAVVSTNGVLPLGNDNGNAVGVGNVETPVSTTTGDVTTADIVTTTDGDTTTGNVTTTSNVTLVNPNTPSNTDTPPSDALPPGDNAQNPPVASPPFADITPTSSESSP